MIVVKKRYEVEEETPFRTGSYGQIFKANDLETGEPVALKTLLDENREDKRKVEKFRTEAMALRALKQHPNIVTIIEDFEFGGRPYIAMEWAKESLQDVLNRNKTERLTPKRAVEITQKILSALDYAHSNGITHLDIHPGNILFDFNKEPKLSDFGLARRVLWESKEGKRILENMQRMSTAGLSMDNLLRNGTGKKPTRDSRADQLEVSVRNFFNYAAPELQVPFENLSEGELKRADIYSLAKVLNRMIIGPRNFSQRLGATEAKWSGKKLEGIIERGMNLVPENRYGSAQEMSKVLSRLKSYDEREISLGQRIRENAKVVVPLGGVVLAGLIFGAIWVSTSAYQRSEAKENSRLYHTELLELKREVDNPERDLEKLHERSVDLGRRIKAEDRTDMDPILEAWESFHSISVVTPYNDYREGKLGMEEGDFMEVQNSRYDNILKLDKQDNKKEAYDSLVGLVKALESRPQYTSAIKKRTEVLKWKRDKFLPKWIDERISVIGKTPVSQYRAAKTRLDELSDFVESEDLSNQNYYLSKIGSLHQKGRQIESQGLGRFRDDFDEVKREIDENDSRSAQSKVISLLDKLGKANFVYDSAGVSKLRIGVQRYKTRSIDTVREVIGDAKRNLDMRFLRYDRLLRLKETTVSDVRNDRSNVYHGKRLLEQYIETERELKAILGGWDGKPLKGETELKAKVAQYHAQILERCSSGASNIFAYFLSERKRARDLAAKGDYDQSKVILNKIGIEIIASGKDGIGEYRK